MPDEGELDDDPLYVTARQMGHTEIVRAIAEKASERRRLDRARNDLLGVAEKQIRILRSQTIVAFNSIQGAAPTALDNSAGFFLS